MDSERVRLLPAVPPLQEGARNYYENESVSDMGQKQEEGYGPSKKAPQYIAAVAVTMGAVSAGTVLAWTSPISTKLESGKIYDFPISTEELGWIGSIMNLGALVACLLIAPLCEKIGRKLAMLVLVIPFMVGWALIIWASSIEMIYAGRFITGMAGGAFCVSAPLYTSEIAQLEIKGALGSYFQLLLTVGILLSYVFGAFVEGMAYSIICAIPPLIFVVAFFFQPETPIYLLKIGKKDEAEKSLRHFRGPDYNVAKELEEMDCMLREEKELRERETIKENISKTETKKGLIIIMALMFFQQLSGINAVIFYTSDIFKAAEVKLEPELASIIVGVMQVLATFAATYLVERLGRKMLLLVSDFMMGVCALLLGVFFTLKDRDVIDAEGVKSIGFLPILAMCLFIIVFSLGFGPIPWMIASDLFSPGIRSFAGSAAGTFNWFLAFLVTRFFLTIKDGIGGDSVFYIFGGLSLLGTVFVWIFIPETKGLTVEEVHAKLRGDKVSTSQRQGVENPAFDVTN